MNAPRVERRDVDGVLLLDKPQGLTSQQAVARVKRLFQARKAGHTGTLDPMADGLLPIGLGEATKFSRFLLDADKGYVASLRLGVTTTTGDAEGEILEQRPVTATEAEVDAAIRQFVGAQNQMPPMHSALKLAGKPLYAYARAGITLERETRAIVVHKIQLIDYKEKYLKIRVLCSKGTYIRVLAEDIGRRLGCGAHLTGLTRECAGGFLLNQAVSLETLESLPMDQREVRLMPVDTFASSLDRIDLTGDSVRRIITGQDVQQPATVSGLYRLYGIDQGFLGVGEVGARGLRACRLMRQSVDADKPENCLSNPSVTG